MPKKEQLFKWVIVLHINGKKMPNNRFFVYFKEIMQENRKSVCAVCGDKFDHRGKNIIKEVVNADTNGLVPLGSDVRKNVAAKFRCEYKKFIRCPNCVQRVIDNSIGG
jgi:hypothetical protein